MAETEEMSSGFAKAYAAAFMDEGETRDLRWEGVVKTSAAADYRTVEVLLRLAFGNGAPGGTKKEELTEAYQAVLSTIGGDGEQFDPVNAQRELQLLAASVLVHLFERLPDAALGVITTSFGGARKCDLPWDLVGEANRALIEFSKRNRKQPIHQAPTLPIPKIEFVVSDAAVNSMDGTTWKAELERFRKLILAATNAVVQGQNRITKQLTRQIQLSNEELDMLWWLIGGVSETTETSFNEVNPAARPLPFSKELAQMTLVSPGPASVGNLLARAGVGQEGLQVQAAINAVDIEWAHTVSGSKHISPVSTPLHFALERRAEIRADQAWQAPWEAMTSLAADREVSAIELATLFYREHLFLHVME